MATVRFGAVAVCVRTLGPKNPLRRFLENDLKKIKTTSRGYFYASFKGSSWRVFKNNLTENIIIFEAKVNSLKRFLAGGSSSSGFSVRAVPL